MRRGPVDEIRGKGRAVPPPKKVRKTLLTGRHLLPQQAGGETPLGFWLIKSQKHRSLWKTVIPTHPLKFLSSLSVAGIFFLQALSGSNDRTQPTRWRMEANGSQWRFREELRPIPELARLEKALCISLPWRTRSEPGQWARASRSVDPPIFPLIAYSSYFWTEDEG
ncbi:MAG: hypothetical protein NZ959_06165 [Armatimonadetes bacterium]|nr:hypothetical protein [Armatimonadota bacterium]MDW8121628.1 hypothetical protein [Armatimonadota bacterium]